MSTDSKIHVALASDDNYFVGLLTTIWSIARNCSRPQDLVFHILDGGISKANWEFLVKIFEPKRCTITNLPVNQKESFDGFKAFHGSGTMTYARLLLPDILPEIDQVVYSDVDILWLVDIAEMWDKLNPHVIMHITPFGTPTEEQVWFTSHGYDFRKDPSFCAGMIVMNLKKFREEGLHYKMMETIRQNNGDLPLCDQTAMNIHMFGRKDKQYLDRRWQRPSGGTLPLPEEGFVLHFCGDTPWKSVTKTHHMITNQHLLWHRYHAEAHKTTVWQSLRIGNRTIDILVGRLLYLLATKFTLAKSFLHLVMILKGKKSNITCLDYYLEDFTLPKSRYW